MKNIQLFSHDGERVSIIIRAHIEDDTDDLVIGGQDTGPAVEEQWGDSDYEYWLRISADQKLALFQSFEKELIDYSDERLLIVIGEKFSAHNAITLLKQHCAAHGIAAHFSNYA